MSATPTSQKINIEKEKKRIVITGASRGIGLAAVRIFSELGHQIVAIADDFAGFPNELLPKIECITFDLRQIDEIPRLAHNIGLVDVLVNNAGIYPSVQFSKYTSQQILDVFTINTIAPAELSLRMAQQANSRLNRIVMVGSVSAHEGAVNGYYAASKAALENIVKSLAIHFIGTKVRVNTISPGLVEGTNVFNSVPKNRRADLYTHALTGAFTSPEEVAQCIVWLALDAPSNLTGATIDINGGAYLR